MSVQTIIEVGVHVLSSKYVCYEGAGTAGNSRNIRCFWQPKTYVFYLLNLNILILSVLVCKATF